MNDTGLGQRSGGLAVHLHVVITEKVLRWSTSAQEASDRRDDRGAPMQERSVETCGIGVKDVIQSWPVAIVQASRIPVEKVDDRGSIIRARKRHYVCTPIQAVCIARISRSPSDGPSSCRP